MAFSLGALGAGLGQFAEQYQRQQQQQRQTLMLQMQLADFQRRQEAEKRDTEAANLALNFGLPSSGVGAAPIPGQTLGGGMPAGGDLGGGGGSQVSAGAGSFGEYGGNQSGLETLRRLAQQVAGSALGPGYSVAETSGFRPGAGVTGTGGVSQHALGNALDLQISGPQGPIPNTGEDATGLYGKLALAMRAAAPPDIASKLGWGGNFTTGPQNGPRDLMHFDLGGDRGRYGTLAQMAQAPSRQSPLASVSTLADAATAQGLPGSAGAQMAQASPAPAAASPIAGAPEPPPPPRDIALLLRKQNPTASSQAIISAAQEVWKREQENYKIAFEKWKAGTSLGLEAAGQAETARSHRVGESRAGQRIDLEAAGQAETGRYHRAEEGQAGRRQTEVERANRAREQNAAKAVQARVDKTRGATDLATTELDTLANEADQLAAMVEADPKLVGAKGAIRRLGSSVGEQLGIVEEDPSVAQFKNKIQLLQSRLAKPLLGARYFSKPSQDRLNELLPGLQRLDNPTLVKESLKNVSNILKERSASTKAAAGSVSDDFLKGMSDQDLLNQIAGPE